MGDRQALFRALRRRPDVEAENLFAYDASDALVLDEALALGPLPPDVVVIGDRYGALTLGTLQAGASRVRVHQDSIVGERALAANAAAVGEERFEHHPLGAALLAGASFVLVQLPRSLDALQEIADHIAAHADADVRVIAGGRVKHMSLGMNRVLESVFTEVRASHARAKSRALHASAPRAAEARKRLGDWPRRAVHDLPGIGCLEVAAYGAAFAGTAIDIGTRALLTHLPAMPEVDHAVDLACGTGVIGTALALTRSDIRISATDVSASAVASAFETSRVNGVDDRIDVRGADGLELVPSASAQLILLNPPFHIGATVHTGVAERLIVDAGRALATSGELWCVWNAHLRYRPLLERIGPTRQVSRNAKFVVTATRR